MYPRVHMRLKRADIDVRPTLFARTLTDCKCARDTQGQFADIENKVVPWGFNALMIYKRVNTAIIF